MERQIIELLQWGIVTLCFVPICFLSLLVVYVLDKRAERKARIVKNRIKLRKARLIRHKRIEKKQYIFQLEIETKKNMDAVMNKLKQPEQLASLIIFLDEDRAKHNMERYNLDKVIPAIKTKYKGNSSNQINYRLFQ